MKGTYFMTDYIVLSTDAIAGFSKATRAEIAAHVTDAVATAGAVVAADDGEGPADLSVAQARRFLERCSEKTQAALRVIAKAPVDGFKLSAVAAALKEDSPGKLRGVWSGLTKRVRTVLGDPAADLIWWDELGDDWTGYVSPTTHRSLCKVFGY
jgi:hypothetical protein